MKRKLYTLTLRLRLCSHFSTEVCYPTILTIYLYTLQSYIAFHSFGQAKLDYHGGLVLGSCQC